MMLRKLFQFGIYCKGLPVLLSETVTGSLFIECHRYKPAYFFNFDQESPILLSGTITGSLFICSKMVRYKASVCSSVVPSGLDLFIAQPMLPGRDSLLAQPIFRPRLLACSADASGQDSLLDLGLVEYPALLEMSASCRGFFPSKTTDMPTCRRNVADTT